MNFAMSTRTHIFAKSKYFAKQIIYPSFYNSVQLCLTWPNLDLSRFG